MQEKGIWEAAVNCPVRAKRLSKGWKTDGYDYSLKTKNRRKGRMGNTERSL